MDQFAKLMCAAIITAILTHLADAIVLHNPDLLLYGFGWGALGIAVVGLVSRIV